MGEHGKRLAQHQEQEEVHEHAAEYQCLAGPDGRTRVGWEEQGRDNGAEDTRDSGIAEA